MAPERGAARSGTIGSVQEGEPQKRDDQLDARKGSRQKRNDQLDVRKSCRKGASDPAPGRGVTGLPLPSGLRAEFLGVVVFPLTG